MIPIPLPGRRDLVTPREAGACIAVLRKTKQQSPEWQAATKALIMAAEDRGPLMHAHVGMMLACTAPSQFQNTIHRRKKHWGQRKIKRDE
jgi:hypothetical protein